MPPGCRQAVGLNMFSRCEYCQHQQRITVKQLRKHRGLLKCKQCGKPFDALASLSEKYDSRLAPAGPNENALPWIAAQTPANPQLWRTGSLVMLWLLIGQGLYFEGGGWLWRLPQIHAMATSVCQPLRCAVPTYRNLDLADWSVSHSDLQAYLQGHYLFTAAISNQAAASQAFPDLKLTLLDFNGQPVAERVFSPRQYVDQAELAGEETRAVQLWLAEPAAAVGGFNVSVL